MLAKRCQRWKGELTCAAQGVAAAFSTGFGCGIGGKDCEFDREIRKFAAKNLNIARFSSLAIRRVKKAKYGKNLVYTRRVIGLSENLRKNVTSNLQLLVYIISDKLPTGKAARGTAFQRPPCRAEGRSSLRPSKKDDEGTEEISMSNDPDKVWPTGLTLREAEEVHSYLIDGTRVFGVIALIAHSLVAVSTPWLG
jgi:light-harvesting protein B-800-850 beta chain